MITSFSANFSFRRFVKVLTIFTNQMDFIERIRQHLAHPLPGRIAHELMSPKLVNGNRVRFPNSSNPRKGAVLILLYQQNKEFHFPLIQRPKYEGVHSGQVAFPGGKEETSDPTLQYTALREAEEEIGVNSKEVEVLGNLSEFYVGASNHLILPVVGFHHSSPSFQPDNYEVEEVIRAPLAELLDQKRKKEKEITTSGGYKLLSPYYDIQDKVVWGATAMILSEFSEIIRKL